MILIKMHLGLIKFINREFPKLKTFTQKKNFTLSLGKAYLKELLRVYKQAFLNLDPLYRVQKKKYNEQMKLKKNLQLALKLLKYIDKQMMTMGKNRQQRRAFWREFFRNGDIRIDVFNQLEKEIK
jgi:hypothetical protein